MTENTSLNLAVLARHIEEACHEVGNFILEERNRVGQADIEHKSQIAS
ncbi:MAG: hypothetical protein U5L96_11400 [Owenweeksia sp.]|nr:hypothetical protein [Owenweeksia sp.]